MSPWVLLVGGIAPYVIWRISPALAVSIGALICAAGTVAPGVPWHWRLVALALLFTLLLLPMFRAAALADQRNEELAWRRLYRRDARLEETAP